LPPRAGPRPSRGERVDLLDRVGIGVLGPGLGVFLEHLHEPGLVLLDEIDELLGLPSPLCGGLRRLRAHAEHPHVEEKHARREQDPADHAESPGGLLIRKRPVPEIAAPEFRKNLPVPDQGPDNDQNDDELKTIPRAEAGVPHPGQPKTDGQQSYNHSQDDGRDRHGVPVPPPRGNSQDPIRRRHRENPRGRQDREQVHIPGSNAQCNAAKQQRAERGECRQRDHASARVVRFPQQDFVAQLGHVDLPPPVW